LFVNHLLSALTQRPNAAMARAVELAVSRILPSHASRIVDVVAMGLRTSDDRATDGALGTLAEAYFRQQIKGSEQESDFRSRLQYWRRAFERSGSSMDVQTIDRLLQSTDIEDLPF